MSAIAWLSRQEIVALGWTLLHFCWQGTAVAVAYAIIDRMTAHATSKVRYIVPLAALIIMPAIVIGTFAVELRVATPVYSIGSASTNASVDPSIWPTPALHELSLASGLENSKTSLLTMRASSCWRFVRSADGFTLQWSAEEHAGWCLRKSSVPSSAYVNASRSVGRLYCERQTK